MMRCVSEIWNRILRGARRAEPDHGAMLVDTKILDDMERDARAHIRRSTSAVCEAAQRAVDLVTGEANGAHH